MDLRGKAAIVTGSASGIGRATALVLARRGCNVVAHPGWPWTEEMTAVALHKGNVFWELSGWAPQYFPPQLKTDIRGRLRDKILFGSDYPSIPYERLLREWGELGYSDEILEGVFHRNAERVLGL